MEEDVQRGDAMMADAMAGVLEGTKAENMVGEQERE